MTNGDIKLNPHKARHWFVTTRLREIHNISKYDSEIHQRKNELIKYMKWKNPDTIRVYEHYFDEEKQCLKICKKMKSNMNKVKK